MIDAGVPTIAATLLWRCLALVGDSGEVVCELVSALESALLYPDALEVLEKHAALRGRSFLARYLYGFNAAMAGKLAITRDVLGALAPDSPETTSMRATLAGIVERADRIAGIRRVPHSRASSSENLRPPLLGEPILEQRHARPSLSHRSASW